MLILKTDLSLNVVEDFDEVTQIPDEAEHNFKCGDFIDADLLDGTQENDCIDIQFGDGSIALGVPVASFIEVDFLTVPFRFHGEVIKFAKGEQVSRDFSKLLEHNEEVAHLCAQAMVSYKTIMA